MFIISLTYTKPFTEADKYLARHYEYIDKYITEGKFIIVGRKVPRTGGVIICNVETRGELERIMQEDPFTVHSIGEFEIIEIVPTRYISVLKDFLEL
ncbi:MAG: YciI family protein [Rikenellaceae bacterium]|nr:YciI family protein [Rikenellaceae bacterium]